jgi:dTDP-4-amino-4,6-dideoxygalactose transaminase
VEGIEKIAKARGLKVIYDAAHAFGVRNSSTSLLAFGDLSVLSFHATKVFNTFEGGAIVSHDPQTKKHIDQLRNFGFETEITVVSAGINSKMSEFNAALGIVQLKGLKDAVQRRKAIATRYREGLARVKGIQCVAETKQWTPNYAYFPVMVMPDFPLARDALYKKLAESNIFGRRYFYPLISDFPMYKDLPSAAHANLPVARTAANRVLCLPMSANMDIADADRVIARVAEARGA